MQSIKTKKICIIMIGCYIILGLLGCNNKASEESMKAEIESLKSEMSNYTSTSETVTESIINSSKDNGNKTSSTKDKNIWFGNEDYIVDKLNEGGFGCSLLGGQIHILDDRSDYLVFNYSEFYDGNKDALNYEYSVLLGEDTNFDNYMEAYFALITHDYNNGLFNGTMYVRNNGNNGYVTFDGGSTNTDTYRYFIDQGNCYGGVYICDNRILQIYYRDFQSLSGKTITRDDFVDEILTCLELPTP